MSEETAHLTSAIKAIEEGRRSYAQDIDVDRADRRDRSEPVVVAHMLMERQQLLIKLLLELRRAWRNRCKAQPEDGRQFKTMVPTGWVDWPLERGGTGRAQLQLLSDPAMNELVCTLHTTEGHVGLWQASRQQMKGANWPRKVDNEITAWGKAVSSGDLPPLTPAD